MAAGSRLLYRDRSESEGDAPAAQPKPHKRPSEMTLDEYNASFGTPH